jgi:hypothetical protein
MPNIVRIVPAVDGSWLVKLGKEPTFSFKKRYCAEAFGVALANRVRTEVHVLGRDGTTLTKPDVRLTSTAVLD